MYIGIVSIIAVACILLILVVLAQNSKGGGLSDQFGGSASSQMIGVKRTGDLLEKITWGLAIGVMVLSLGANMALPKVDLEEEVDSSNIEKARETPLPQAQQQPAAIVPETPAEQTQEEGAEKPE